MPLNKVFTKKKTVIVIGGAGFIGSHLCDELIKKCFVVCIDNLEEGSERNIDHLLSVADFKFIKHDMNEPINLEERSELQGIDFKFHGIGEVYHLAALTSPKKFKNAKLKIFDTSFLATKNALEMAAKYKAKFFLASSSVIYGKRPDDKTFFQEDYYGYVDPMGVRCCYDEGKRCAESLAAIFKEKFSMDVRIARIFRTFGTKMKLRDGRMLPDFVFNALDGSDLVIYGDESFSTSLCYVSDIVEGIIKLMELDSNIGPVNLGSDQNYKLTYIAERIIKITGQFLPLAQKSKIIFKPELEFMTPLGLPSIYKAKEKLGWIPIVTLDKGLTRMVDYIMANKNLINMETMGG